MTLFSSLWYALSLFSHLSNFDEHPQTTTFFMSSAFALYHNLILYHFLELPCIIIFSIQTMIMKSLLLYFYSFDYVTIEAFLLCLLLDLLSFFNKIIQERRERKFFFFLNKRKESADKFKSFLNKQLPEALIIIGKLEFDKFFANQAFQKILSETSQTFESYRELLKTLVVEENTSNPREVSETINSMSPGLNPLNLWDFLGRGVQLNSFETSPVGIQASMVQNDVKRIFEVKMFSLFWEEKKAMALIFNDITHQETIISLRLANAHKDKVLATVSHELKNPLNGIIGVIHVVKKKIKDPYLREMLDVCKNNANLLLNIVNSMLDLHLIRKNKIRIYVDKINIRELLEEVRVLFKFQCKKKGIDLEIHITPRVPEILYTDKVRLSEILINLAFNSVKFTYKGKITIGVDLDPDNPQMVMFWVEDTGVGMHEKQMTKLFKMYDKLEDSNSNNTEGIGLGLSISNSLVRMLAINKNESKGLQVESEHKKGSKFYFSISRDLSAGQKRKDGSMSILGSSINEDNVVDEKIMPYSSTIRSITLKSRNLTPSLTTPIGGKGSLDGNRGIGFKPLQIDLEYSVVQGSSSMNLNSVHSYKEDSVIQSGISANSGDSDHGRAVPSELESSRTNSECSEFDFKQSFVRNKYRARTSIFKRVYENKHFQMTRQKPILVVDDNPFNLLVVQKLIQEHGIEVKSALNGRDAIKKVKEEFAIYDSGFRLIFMDLQMPIMDGYEAAKELIQLMSQGIIPKTPIVALTANDGEEDVEMCLKVGMKAHLAKPLKPEHLAKILSEY